MPDVLDTFGRMLGAESGNRHRNADGSVVTSPKGAIGIAQVMPATGPEAAKAAGLPWDPVKFKNDPAYNKALGAGYYRKQVTRFGGDERAATASYNAGPNRVARLKQQYGANWEAHLPDETTDYLAKVHGAVTPSGQGQGAVRLVDIPPSKVASNAAPRAIPEKSADPLNPYQLGPQVGREYTKMREQGNQVEDSLSQTLSTLDTLRTQGIDAAKQVVDTKKAVLSDVEAQTLETQERLKPIFAKQAALAHRRSELAEMSPIKKAILGIFDRNYNEGRLKEIEDANADEARVIGSQYAQTVGLQDSYINAITGKADADSTVRNLLTQDAQLDHEALTQGWQMTRQQVQDSLMGVNAGGQVAAAQAQATERTIADMTPGQLNTALSQAQRGPNGVAVINGVEVSAQRITERQRQLDGQAMAMEQSQLALQAQKMNLAEAAANNMVSHMSQVEVDQAIKDGGVFKGVQLDQGQLTAAKQNYVNRNSLLAGESVTNIDAQTYTQMVDGFNGATQSMIGRLQGVVGQRVPPQVQAYLGNMTQQARLFAQALGRAPEAARPQMRAQFLGEMQKMIQGQDKLLDGVAQSMTRDKDAQIVIGQILKGVTPTGEQAVRGLLALATSNGGAMVPGMQMGGPGGEAMKAATAAVQGVYQKYGAQNKTGMDAVLNQGNKVSKGQLQQELEQAVSDAVSRTWVGANMKKIKDSIPTLAKQMGDPFGQVNPDDYRASQVTGQRAGLEKLGTRLGLSAEQTELVFGSKGGKDKYDAVMKGKANAPSWEQAATWRGTFVTQETLRALDRSPSADGMRERPSSLLIRFTQSPKFQQTVGGFARSAGQGGFGESLAGAVSGGSLGEVSTKYFSALNNAQGAIVAEDTQTSRQQATLYRGSPLKRAGVIMGAIPGLNKQDESLLMAGVKQQLMRTTNPGLAAGEAMGSKSAGSAMSEQIDSFILHGKFEDPALERRRQIAAKHWAAYSASTDTAMERFFNGIWEN